MGSFVVVIRIQNKLCVAFPLFFSLKRLQFLTPARLRENTAIFTWIQGKVGSNTLDNLWKVDIPQLSNFYGSKSKRYLAKDVPLKVEGWVRWGATNPFLAFHCKSNNKNNTSKFSRELAVLVYNQMYKEIKIVNYGFLF